MSMPVNILDKQTQVAYDEHKAQWECCVRCAIGPVAHKHVFCRGTLPCDVLFIGEAPGKTEDVTGFPFVGRAGKLMDEWINSSVQYLYALIRNVNDLDRRILARDPFTWAICNLTLCRPTNEPGGPNRAPTGLEILNCRPRLEAFIALAKPKAIVLVGRPAQREAPLYAFPRSAPVLKLVHPAYILRKGGRGVPEDLEARVKLSEFIAKELGNGSKKPTDPVAV